MDSEIKLSVIIPAYNPGKKIIPCLKSVGKNLNYLSENFNLTYEVLIINDASILLSTIFPKNSDSFLIDSFFIVLLFN